MNMDIILRKKLNIYLNYIDIIYWINLERSHIRYKNMLNILANINIPNIRIIGIDGKNITDFELYSSYILLSGKQNSITKIEYACLLSHIKTIDEFSKSQQNIALICEDDISLDFVKYWNKSVYQIINDAPKDWDIIMLNYVYHKSINKLYTYNNGSISSCLSYLINKKGANKLMSKLKIEENNKTKYKLNYNLKHTADNFIFKILNTYTYKYSYFTFPDDNNSTIHTTHLNYHKRSKKMIQQDWEKFYDKTLNYKINKNICIFTILCIIIIYFIENFINLQQTL